MSNDVKTVLSVLVGAAVIGILIVASFYVSDDTHIHNNPKGKKEQRIFPKQAKPTASSIKDEDYIWHGF